MSQTAKKYEFPSPGKGVSADDRNRSFPDDWYLVPYQTISPSSVRRPWKPVLLAALLVAALAGILTCWTQYHSQLEAVDALKPLVEQPPAPLNSHAEIAQDVQLGASSTAAAAVHHVVGAEQSPDDPTMSQDDAARLKARNRRLEALVKVLRRRTSDEKALPARASASR